MAGVRDRFDYETYWWLLGRITATHRCVRFADLLEGEPAEPYFLLRHDIDYSPAAALTLAKQEAERGVAATYFILPNSMYYNILTPEHGGFAREIASLGHEIGLHYDVNFFHSFPRTEWEGLLQTQARLLGELAGTTVMSIALHQPGLNHHDPFRGNSSLGFLNAYDDRFIREMTYVSDSCRAWRDSGWQMFESGDLPRKLHLTLHPINWAEEDRDRETIFRSVHDDLCDSIHAAGDELLEKIAAHSGVREHEARKR